MCVILDANAQSDVFGDRKTVAGREFYEWLETPRARLVVGGKLWSEEATSELEKWAEIAQGDGRIRPFGHAEVENEEAALLDGPPLKSDDPHVIALARVSRARILYSHDKALCEDFKDRRLVPNPRGRIYPTHDSRNASRNRRNLLGLTNLCPNR